MTKQNKKLDEMEFKHATEIRKPEEDDKSNQIKTKTPVLYILFIFILILAVIFEYFFFGNQLKPLSIKISKLETINKKLTLTNKQILDKNTILSGKIQEAEKQFKTSSKGKKELITLIKQLKKEKKEQYSKRKTIEKRLSKLEKKIKQYDNKLLDQKQKNTKLKEEITTLNLQITEHNKLNDSLNIKLQKTIKKLKLVQNDYNEEVKASKEIVKSLYTKDNELKKAKKTLSTTLKDLDKIEKQLHKLKTIENGELVSYSEKLIAANPVLKKTAIFEKTGIFNKIKGFVLVNVLINQFGEVENAVFLDYQVEGDVDKSTVISKALKTAMQWKFSPPLYKGEVKVKVWQPILIKVTTK